MKHLVVIFLSALLLTACAYREPVASAGTYTIDGKSYSFTSLRIDHVGYVKGDSSQFILRLTGYPGTFSMDTVRHKGHGTVLQLFVIAPGCELYPGDRCTHISTDSLSHVITISENGDTVSQITISAATVTVSAADNNFTRYDFTLTSSGVETTGQYTGKHTLNRLVDQPSCGFIDFDTIHTALAAATMYNWGHLFGNDFNYHEFIIYSTNSRFTDDGKLRQGVQFSVGFMSPAEDRPLDGDYPVSLEMSAGHLMYGHKVQDAHWGTYWNVFYSGSSVGKANILSGKLTNLVMKDGTASFTFDFTDQLDNAVTGSFTGRVVNNTR